MLDQRAIGLLAVDVPFEFGSWLGSVGGAVDFNFISDVIARESARNDGTIVR